jgi:hypothetical protein
MNIINNASAQFILPSRIAEKCREYMDIIAAAPASGKLEAFNTGLAMSRA